MSHRSGLVALAASVWQRKHSVRDGKCHLTEVSVVPTVTPRRVPPPAIQMVNPQVL